MDPILEKVNELKKELYDLPEVKEFLKFKKLFENDEHLKNLRKEIANAHTPKEKESKMKEYNNNPIVVNYNSYKNDVMDIINTITNIIK